MGKGGKAVWYRRRRHRKAACIGITVVLVIVLIVLVVLYLAIYRPKDPRVQVPTMQLLSLYPVGYVYPLSAVTNANLTLNLLVSIYNPNRATFIVQAGGMACLYYDGAQVGFTPIPTGSVPAQASSTIAVPVTVQGSSPLQGTFFLNDVADGILQVQTTVTIIGKATTLNLFTQHSDVVSKCSVSVSFASRGIESYTCDKSFSLDP